MLNHVGTFNNKKNTIFFLRPIEPNLRFESEGSCRLL